MAAGIFDAYIGGEASALFNTHFANVKDRRRVRAAVRPLSPAMHRVLTLQNARYFASPARDANLVALGRGAPAVVTGQQMGLFLGPLFTVYKVASAIRVAQALSAEWGEPVVPVFWLQTEDHDLPEIAECNVLRATGEALRLQLPVDPANRISVAHVTLPADVTARLCELHDELRNLPHAEAHVARLARHYRPGAGWAEAFAGVLAELFASDGLVLINPREVLSKSAESDAPTVAKIAAPIHWRATEDATALADALTTRVRALESAGFSAAVHVRAGAPLSFFHPRGADGPRYRLEPRGAVLSEVGGDGTHSLHELRSALEADPLSFSTSALLRPIVQDSLLPTVAYVGGPGEIAYFAQLLPLYAALDVPMPLLIPRTRIRIVEGKARHLLERLGLEAADVTKASDLALRAVRAPHHPRELDTGLPDASAISAALLRDFEANLHALKTPLLSVGPGLESAIDKTRSTVQGAVHKLVEKYERALAHRDQGLAQDVQRLKGWLYPHDIPQERFYGMAYFAAQYGEREWLERVLATTTPFDAAPKELHL